MTRLTAPYALLAILAFLTVGGLLLWGATRPTTRPAEPLPPPSPDAQAAATGESAFAFDLYAQLAPRPGNLFFSPYSIGSALTLVWEGARGTTATEINAALHVPEPEKLRAGYAALYRRLQANPQNAGYQLAVANRLWGAKAYPFLPDYLDRTEKSYGASLEPLDFTQPKPAAATINAWVESQTHDRIKDLIAPGDLGPATRLVLTNAIYFKGDWDSPFKKPATQDGDFTTDSGQKIKTPFMHQNHEFAYAELDAENTRPALQALEMNYAGDNLSMLILLPEPGQLPTLEAALDAPLLAKIVAQLHQREIPVTLPRFTLTDQFELAKPLQSLGIKAAFNDADFSGITTREGLVISKVLHKAFVDVNEEGTEAAAATGGAMAGSAMPRPQREFKADHPFIFLIRDKATGAILFLGRLANPTP